MENSMEFPKKFSIELSYDPGIPLLDITKGTENRIAKKRALYVHCSIIYNSPMWEQPKCALMDEKQKMLHTCNGILFSIREKEMWPLVK